MADYSNKLILNHMFLYSKGWYKYTKNLWEGYRRAILCDGHYHPLSLKDVAYIMYKHLMLNKEAIIGKRDDMDFYIHNEIRHTFEELTTYPCYTKIIDQTYTSLEMYDLAVVWTCHNFFKFTDSNKFEKKLMPSKRVMPLDIPEGKTGRTYYLDILDRFGNDVKPYDVNDECSMHMWKYIKKDYSVDEEIKSGKLVYQKTKKMIID